MINSMVAATISQNGLDKNSPMEGRRKACMFFAKMMFKAKSGLPSGNFWLAVTINCKNWHT